MKTIIGILVIAFLNTGCGAHKQTKAQNQVDKTSASYKIREIKNHLTQVESYEVNGQQKFIVIAKMERSSLGNLALNMQGNLIRIGSLELTRHKEEFAETFKGTKPVPALSDSDESHPEVPVFLIQNDADLSDVSIGVPAFEFDNVLKPRQESRDITYNYDVACVSLKIRWKAQVGSNDPLFPAIFDGITFSCNEIEDCVAPPFASWLPAFHRNYNDLIKAYPDSDCQLRGFRFTEQARVYNLSTITHYTVNLVDAMKTQFAKFGFLPASSGN